jgi:digeranylgeranylglycerophospholipid reductase
MYDVVVIGAGPAGSITARTLAERGACVLLVEKRPEIGVPVRCGEATGIAGLEQLGARLGKGTVRNRVRGAVIYSPSRYRVEFISEEPIGYILDRRLFDKALAHQAADAGAEVMAGTAATGITRKEGRVAGVELRKDGEGETVRCSCVVGADGVESLVGRWAGLSTRSPVRELTSCAEYELVGVELERTDVMEFYFGSRVAPGGYAWVFPKGDGVANVGIGVRGANSSAIHRLREFIKNMDNLSSGTPTRLVAGGVPVGGPLERTVAQGVLLVGDAARQIDPLTGGGIYNAMHCGAIAGEVLARAVEAEDFSQGFLMEYEDRWRKELGSVLDTCLRLKKILDAMSDEDIDTAARLMGRVNIGVRKPGEGPLHQGMSIDIMGFLQGLLLKN